MVAFLCENWVVNNQIQTQERRLLQLPRPQLSVISPGVAATLTVALLLGAYFLFADSDPAIETSPQTASQEPSATAESEPPVESSRQRNPFEYEIISEEWQNAFGRREMRADVRVEDDVAPTVTEADLESLAPVFLERYGGESFHVSFYTETPLVQAWAAIDYSPFTTTGDKLKCDLFRYAWEMGPWYFPERIDPDTEWHQRVWLTLPMVNKIVNGATQYHWEVTDRTANEIYLDSKLSPKPGTMKDDMRLNPDTWEISTYDGDVPRFVRLVESSLTHLDYEFSQEVVGKLNSVIGSQEYLNGDKVNWTWMIDRLEVMYLHLHSDDTITIMQTQP